MNHKTQTTTGHILKEVLAEMSQMGLVDQARVLRFALRLHIRRQRHKALNVCLSLIVLTLLIYSLAACSPYADLVPTAAAEPTASKQGNTHVTLPTPTLETCIVQTGIPSGSLNLRTGTGTQYAVIRVLNEGETLTVLAAGSWLAVMDSAGNQGYVNSHFCK
jgi:hypothetical protein